MKIVTIIGTRPQLIKAAALQPVLRATHEEVLVDTGQHWDDNLAGTFFRELGLARADYSLNAGATSNVAQVATILTTLAPILERHRPEVVLVFGDTNSTLGGALAGAKAGYPVAHIEAGLRSFDRRMPEELNRIVTDHLSTWLFAPTPAAVTNLKNEGIEDGVRLVGDLMQVMAARTLESIRGSSALGEIAAVCGLAARGITLRPGSFLYATVHRQENREPEAISQWSALFRRASSTQRPVVLSLHPGTRKAILKDGANLGNDVFVVEPLGYRSSMVLQLHAAAVLTDSGGIQREAAWLGTPCLVLRSSTEWTEAVSTSRGRMVVVGLDVEAALQALDRLAPAEEAPRLAAARVASAHIGQTEAAELITQALQALP